MIETQTYTEKQRRAYDPTHTTTLRNAFSREMRRRFSELISVIRKSVAENDCFGLKKKDYTLIIQQMNPAPSNAFAFSLSQQKVEAFMKWLQQQVDAGILTVGQMEQLGRAYRGAWTDLYVLDSYKRGVIRARYELIRAGYDIPSIEESGGIGVVMGGTPFHLDRVGLLYIRVFNELKGITDAMDSIIARILAQGMADGDGPALLARKLVAAINGSGVGDLGLKDAIGRVIPPMRRAMLLARTEIIRAHHLATIQEYRNWGVLGIKVMGEWKTAGDNRVCDKCASLEGQIFTLDEIEPMIPLHPQCFIDPQIPIYTSEGWKPIGKIEVGDLVLTHERRFRKVYALPRHMDKVEVVTLKFKGDLKLTITSNHPILTEGGIWKNAGDCTEDDKIMILGNECKRCELPIPYFRKYCSRTCLSKDITDKQWADPIHRKIVSEKNRLSNLKQYADGSRDRFAVTKKANKKTRLMIKEGNHPFQREDVIEKNKLVTNLPKHRKASSKRMLKNNPMNDPIIVQRAHEKIRKHWINNPKRRLNALMAQHRKSGKMTYIEKRMQELLDKIGVDYIYQYPILNYNVDFAIPGLRVVIECDGEYWHQDKQKEQERDARIEQEGWTILHYTGTKINQCLEEVGEELTRVLCNHLGEFDLIPLTIEKIKNWTMQKRRVLYNLSVEEDESYIAKGVVVHNCRCIALPHIVR